VAVINLPAQRLAVALAIVVVSASVAGAQTAPAAPTSTPPHAGSVYAGASFIFQQLLKPEQAKKPCLGSSGASGSFCGDASGISPGAVATLGVFIDKSLSFSVEGSMAKRRAGTASSESHITTTAFVSSANFVHSDDWSIAGLFRGHVRAGERGASIQPVAGAMLAHSTDSLTNRKTTITVPGFPVGTATSADLTTSRTSPGFIAGVDLAGPPRSGVSLTGMARIRWISGPQPESIPASAIGTDKPVPMSVGRISFQFGAGIQWK